MIQHDRSIGQRTAARRPAPRDPALCYGVVRRRRDLERVRGELARLLAFRRDAGRAPDALLGIRVDPDAPLDTPALPVGGVPLRLRELVAVPERWALVWLDVEGGDAAAVRRALAAEGAFAPIFDLTTGAHEVASELERLRRACPTHLLPPWYLDAGNGRLHPERPHPTPDEHPRRAAAPR